MTEPDGRLESRAAADKDNSTALPAKARLVVLVVFDGVEALDVAGPASAFSKAAESVAGSYRSMIASPSGGNVMTNAGLSLAGTHALSAIHEPIDTLLIAGGDEPALRRAIFEDGVAAWLAGVAAGTRRIASVCTGAFALAAAGLLDGRQATTHWRVCDLLQSLCPKAAIQKDVVYVNDGRLWTSAGVTTGLDLALALIEADLGRAVAVEIARNLAMFMFRSGSERQWSPALVAQSDASTRLRELIAWVMNHLADDLSVEALAQRLHMSPRNFARAFKAETHTTPARFVEQARLAHAAALLSQTDWSQERIALLSGFGSVDALQRVFRRHHGMTAEAHRQARASAAFRASPVENA